MTRAPLTVDADSASTVSTTGHLDERMPLVTGLLSGVDRRRTDTTDHVQSMDDRIQMVGSYAQTIAAQVIELGVFRDRTDQQFVDDAVCAEQTTWTSVGPDSSVPLVGAGTSPLPALVRAFELGERAIAERLRLRSRHDYMVTRMGSTS